MSGWGPLERGTRMSSLVNWGESERASLWARVSGERISDIFASISARCSLKCDDKAIGASAMRSKMPVLTFLSDGMSLVRGGASSRRALLDMAGAIISPSYAVRLYDYRKALRQKAVLLRRRMDARFAERAMIPTGSWLWIAREEIAKLLGVALRDFSELLASPMELRFERGGGGWSPSALEDFKMSLSMKRERELASGVPLVGPQRDDVKLICSGMDAALFLSRGQSRRAAAALILATALVVEQRVGRKPVLIFDEVTSELDEGGRHALFEALLDTGCQVFAATADDIDYEGISVYRLKDGRFALP